MGKIIEALFSLDRDKILKFYELAYNKAEAEKFAKVDEKIFLGSSLQSNMQYYQCS